MAETIGQRELRNDNAEIIRRVEAGEAFTVTRHGEPVADLVPHRAAESVPKPTLAQLQADFRSLPPMDVAAWYSERRADDEIFGADDPLDGESRADSESDAE